MKRYSITDFDYVFDNIGNRLSTTNNAETTDYIANSLNQYTNITDGVTNSPTYDLDGNMLSNGDWTYTWNGENRLVSASNGTTVVTFGYDYMGRCYEKVKNANAVDYIWDDFNIISETSNSQTNYNIWGLDLSGTMQGAGGVGGLLSVVQDGESYFTAFDANGNITSYSDTNGTAVVSRVYSAFGETVSLTGTDTFTHWWSTKPWDADTEMSEYEYRKLLVELGRWAKIDSLKELGANALKDVSAYSERRDVQSRHMGAANRIANRLRQQGKHEEAQLIIDMVRELVMPSNKVSLDYNDLNLYALCYNNPVNHTDKNGEVSLCEFVVVVVVVAGVVYTLSGYIDKKAMKEKIGDPLSREGGSKALGEALDAVGDAAGGGVSPPSGWTIKYMFRWFRKPCPECDEPDPRDEEVDWVKEAEALE